MYVRKEGIDTTTAAGKALFRVVGVFAEFERAIIREGVMAGLARFKKHGKQLERDAFRSGHSLSS
jgi:DNA invertase Pin-like site-specific DNA recombinase